MTPNVISLISLASMIILILDSILTERNLKLAEKYLYEVSLESYRKNIDFILSLVAGKTNSLRLAINILDNLHIPEYIKGEIMDHINTIMFFDSKVKDFYAKYPALASLLFPNNPGSGFVLDDEFIFEKRRNLEQQSLFIDELDDVLSLYFFSLFLLPLVIYQIVLLTGRILFLLILVCFQTTISIYQHKKIIEAKTLLT